MALDLEGHQGKSQRLIAACCRCVEWDLVETESLRCLGKYNNRRSLGLMLDDDSVRRRLRNAEAKVQRDSRLPAQPLAVISIVDLVANHPELRRPVIHGLLRAGETMNVIANPKVGKSWLVTDLALSVATGRERRKKKKQTDEPDSVSIDPEEAAEQFACYLRHRAARLGYDIWPDEVYSTERYGMSPAAKYANAIKAEADTLCAATFRQICSMAPPPHFKAIYEADQRSWFQSQRERMHDEFGITT